MAQIFPIDFDEKLTMAQDDYILFSDSEDGNKIKKAQYKNLKGEPGTPGTPGTPGKDGKDGTDGAAATITVGSTTTGAAGSSASVTNSGTSSAAVLDFTIPQGAKGEPGEDGQDGADGAAATITVGTTTTLPAGSSATVTNVGTSQDAILNFGIPKGDSGSESGDVNGPASSTDGDVAIFDGTTGKLIKDGSVALSTLSAGASAGATAVQPGDIGTAAACNTGTSSGNVPILDSNGKLATSTLPGVALTDTFTVSTSSDLTSLSSADQGDIAIVTSENKTYVLSVAPYSTASNWKEILAPTGGVTSFNGQTGAVTYTAPVSSVNNQTGAVMVSEFTATDGGTKVFNLPAVGDNVSDIVSWLNSGGQVMFKTLGTIYGYIVTYRNSSTRVINCSLTSNSSSYWTIEYDASSICTSKTSITYKFFNPASAGSQGQVLTKGASGYDWANPSGGDVVVSSQTGNILQSGMKIWAGTETDYGNLGTYDQNTLYLTIE